MPDLRIAAKESEDCVQRLHRPQLLMHGLPFTITEEKEAAIKAAAAQKNAEEEATHAAVVKVAREKLAQKFDGVQTGAEGAIRKKKMAQHISSAADDK